MAQIEQQINMRLSAQIGLPVETVQFLRCEFQKFGRNPLESSIEILAIENGIDEHKAKILFDLHMQQVRRLDGLAEQKKQVYD